MTAAYGPQVAAYRARFPAMAPVSTALVAATDTFARGWMQVFSDMARRYGVYIVGVEQPAEFRETTDPAEVALFADPDVRPRPRTAFVATGPEVYNEVFMWGPEDVRSEGPAPLRNVVARNKKVPITPIEETIQLTNGPSSGPDAVENLRPFRCRDPGAARLRHQPARVRVRGEAPARGQPLLQHRSLVHALPRPAGHERGDPGRGQSRALGADTPQAWQPLEWMTSTWRAVADRDVAFDYNVTPHMVGNLADLAFDGQTAITQRGLRAPRGAPWARAPARMWATELLPGDPAA